MMTGFLTKSCTGPLFSACPPVYVFTTSCSDWESSLQLGGVGVPVGQPSQITSQLVPAGSHPHFMFWFRVLVSPFASAPVSFCQRKLHDHRAACSLHVCFLSLWEQQRPKTFVLFASGTWKTAKALQSTNNQRRAPAPLKYPRPLFPFDLQAEPWWPTRVLDSTIEPESDGRAPSVGLGGQLVET